MALESFSTALRNGVRIPLAGSMVALELQPEQKGSLRVLERWAATEIFRQALPTQQCSLSM